MAEDVDELRKKVAVACRVLGHEFPGAGHASARIPGTDEMWLRCRGGAAGEGGLVATDVHHIRRLDFDGEGPGRGKLHIAPHETPLHGEIYKARPDVGAVVHVHPRHAVLCSVVGVEFTPVFGGFNPGLARISILGVPVYSRAATVIDTDMAAEMIEVMGDRDIVLLRGHGIAATGKTVEAATTLACRFETLCELMWQVALSGRKPIEITPEDRLRYDPRNPNPVVFPPERDFQGVRRVGGGGGEEEGGGTGWGGYVRKVEQIYGLPSDELDSDG